MQALSLKNPLDNRFINMHLAFFYKIILVLSGTFLLATSAKINIPLFPVPVTMQTAAVLFIGMSYGWRLGGITILTYFLEGLCGMPVFAESVAGPAIFFDPTFGYLLGFIPGAIVSGLLIERGWGSSKIMTFVAGCAGVAIIYLCGGIWLARFVGDAQAVSVGIKPFLLIDTLKVLLLAVIIPMFWRKKASFYR